MRKLITKLKKFFKKTKVYGSVNLRLNIDYYLYELHLNVHRSDLYLGPEGNSHGFGQGLGVNLVDGLSGDVTTDMVKHPLHLTKFTRVRLDNASLIEGVDFDVLKLDVNDSNVVKVMKDLSVYIEDGLFDSSKKPYVTIGYFKPGTGKKYLNKFKDFKCWVAPLYITHNRVDNSEIKINIDVI